MDFAVGDYVLLTGKEGFIRYIGERNHRHGQWYGIELVIGDGTMNGAEHGRTYFACKHGQGVFVRASTIKYKFDADAGVGSKQTDDKNDYAYSQLDTSSALKPSVRHKRKSGLGAHASTRSKPATRKTNKANKAKPTLHTSQSVSKHATSTTALPPNKPNLANSSQSVRHDQSAKKTPRKPLPQLQMDKMMANASKSKTKHKPKSKTKPQKTQPGVPVSTSSSSASTSSNASPKSTQTRKQKHNQLQSQAAAAKQTGRRRTDHHHHRHHAMERPKLQKVDSNIKPSAYLRHKKKQASNSIDFDAPHKPHKHGQLSVDERSKHSISKSADIEHNGDVDGHLLIDMDGIQNILDVRPAERRHNRSPRQTGMRRTSRARASTRTATATATVTATASSSSNQKQAPPRNRSLPPKPHTHAHRSRDAHVSTSRMPPPRPPQRPQLHAQTVHASLKLHRKPPPRPPQLTTASSMSSVHRRPLPRVPPPLRGPLGMRIQVEQSSARNRGMSTPVSPVSQFSFHAVSQSYASSSSSSSQPTAAAAQQPDVVVVAKDGHWRCVYCVRDNLLEFKFCPICGVKRPDEKAVLPASDLQMHDLLVDEQKEWQEILSELQQNDDAKLQEIQREQRELGALKKTDFIKSFRSKDSENSKPPPAVRAQSQSTSDLFQKNSALASSSSSSKKFAAFSLKNWILSPRSKSSSQSAHGHSQSQHNVVAPTSSHDSSNSVLRNILNRTHKTNREISRSTSDTHDHSAWSRSQSEHSSVLQVQSAVVAADDGDREDSYSMQSQSQTMSEIAHQYTVGGGHGKMKSGKNMVRPIHHEQSLVLVPDTPMFSTPTEDATGFEIDDNVSDLDASSDDTLESPPTPSDTTEYQHAYDAEETKSKQKPQKKRKGKYTANNASNNRANKTKHNVDTKKTSNMVEKSGKHKKRKKKIVTEK